MRRIIVICLVVISQWFCMWECLSNTSQNGSRGNDMGEFVVTFYDNCKVCCGKDESHPAYGITASGERARRGYIACNWLPFGTVLEVEGLGIFTVKDWGAKSLFGTPKKPIKHIDVWVTSHAEARRLGKQIRRVILLTK